jgi:hypothetical protein
MNDDPTDLTITNVGDVTWLCIRLYDGKSGEPIADFVLNKSGHGTDSPLAIS